MRRGILALGLAVLASSAWAAAPPVPGSRGFTPEQEAWLEKTGDRVLDHVLAGRFEEAARLAGQKVRLRERIQGRGHRQTGAERRAFERWQRLRAVPQEERAAVARAFETRARAGRLQAQGKFQQAEQIHREVLEVFQKALGDHPETARVCSNVAYCLGARGKHAEALLLSRKALRIEEKALGPDHPDTAQSYNNVASCLHALGRHAEALPLYRKAVRSLEKALGPDHPDTADGYNNLAGYLFTQGEHAEALPLFRKAVRINEQSRGPHHSSTMLGYGNVAGCLQAQGKLAEALPLFIRALGIAEKALGPDHPHTATCRNNVAYCLHEQGKDAEALPLYKKALAVRESALGADHPLTAQSQDNVARTLNNLGKHAEALPLHRKAVAVFEEALGPDHPTTADGYTNLAFCLEAQGKHAEALPLFRKALRIRQKALGLHHPSTGRGYNNVAYCLSGQGKHDEALPLFRKALDIGEMAFGSNHPDTVVSHSNVAACLWHQGRRNESVRLWQQSLRGHEAARILRADSGFDRARKAGRAASPHAALAVGLAGLKQPRNAFAHAEASLARGLLDDLAALTQAERDRAGELRARIAKLEPTLASFSSKGQLDEQKASHEAAKRQYRRLWEEYSDLLASASARAVLPLERIQKAIPADSALVLWVEDLKEIWACVLRAEGAPAWQRLRGGKDSTRADEDDRLAVRTYLTLTDPGSDARRRQNLLDAFGKQRLEPLRRHLKGVQRLFVVPSGAMAYVPAEVISGEYTVSYVPSGSVLARLREDHRAVDGSSLLALGDPTFDRVPPEPPASGVFVKAVLPNGNAAKAGLQPGDVVLSIGSVALDSFDDLDRALAALPAKAEVWREGTRSTVRLAGPLGAVFDPRSARAAARASRAQGAARRGTGHKRLPGTRLEVEAISALVKRGKALLGSDASEQNLDELRARGELKKYRLIHLATHGESDDRMPGRSALILAQDRLPDPVAQVNADRHPYDGRLTVARIRHDWELDADLIVLSACETGLGQDARGEGLLGFSQAFLSRGARSVVLSRWKVDDTATALLMIRFYENLLGKRTALKKPMGRAASLDEARRWLRSLPRKDAEHLAALHTGGVLRGSEGVEKVPSKAKPVTLKGDRPYAHPFYWAAFTLVGDPD